MLFITTIHADGQKIYSIRASIALLAWWSLTVQNPNISEIGIPRTVPIKPGKPEAFFSNILGTIERICGKSVEIDSQEIDSQLAVQMPLEQVSWQILLWMVDNSLMKTVTVERTEVS